MSDITLKRYEPNFKDQLIDLGKDMVWADLSKKEAKERFEWKYEKNPYTETPLCYLALDGEKVVGHRGFVVQNFELSGTNYLFGTPGDSMVHPNYRRQGIFSNLVDFSNDDIIENSNIDLFLSLSTTRATTKATKKYGYVPVGKREKLYRFSFKNIIKNRYEGGLDLDKIITSDNYHIEVTDVLKEEYIVGLMKESVGQERLSNLRDERFYQWRYEECPSDQTFVYLWDKNQLVGYLSMDKDIFSFFNLNLDYYSILEYGYIDIEHFEKLIEIITENLPFIMSYIFTRKKEEISILKDKGFKGSESYLINTFQKRGLLDEEDLPGILVRPATKEINENGFHINDKDTRSENNWELFWSDVH